MVCSHAISDSEKIITLDKLAEYYYIYKLNMQADSVLHEELQIAELSNNTNLKFVALFGNAILNISPSTTSENFDKIVQFLENGIDYAIAQSNNDYIGLGYSRLADILIKRGETEKALDKAKLAMESLSYIKSDSLKAVIYIELGNAYAAKGELVSACTNYNTAFDIATKINSIPLQSEIYHCTSEIYSILNIDDEAKAELEKSLELDKENNYREGIVRDYFDLASLTNEKFFINKTIQLADSFHYTYYILAAKRLMLAYIEVVEKNSEKALNYFETEPDLKQTYLNTGGIAYYYNAVAQIYLYSEKPDSALHYFKLAEYDYLNNFDKASIRNIFWEIGKTYELLNDWPNAINYFTKVMALSKKMNDVTSIAAISDTLSNLYNHLGNYKDAYSFSRQAIDYQSQLRSISKGKDIALLGVVRENRKHAEEMRKHDQQMKRSRDLQYLSISIVIGVIFLCLLVVGAFPVSKLTIKMLGYFFFISLFEFIVLFIDNIFLSSATHNEPLKLWIIKIALIATLVPIQHFLEHNLIKFLQSRKLLEARTKFSFKNWWKKVQKPSPASEEEIENDTAVL